MTKYLKIAFLPALLIIVGLSLFGCASKVEPVKVYKEIIAYAEEDNNIFNVVKNDDLSKIEINIAYKPAINSALLEEQQIYLQTSTPRSDFYLLKEIYEPTLYLSLNFLITNLNILNQSKEFSKEDSGLILDKFKTLKKSITEFQNALNSLNYYEKSFTNKVQDGNNMVYEYTLKRSMVYKQLDNFKIKFAKIINDSFELNNTFMDTYYKVYKAVDYRENPQTELEGLYVQMICNQTIAKLAKVAFLIDGVKCNFLNTPKSSFEIENESSIIDHTYIKHLSQISNSTKALTAKVGTDFQKFDNDGDMKNRIIVLQTQLESFDKLYEPFMSALKGVDYKAFVSSNKSLEEYADTLNNEQKSKLYVVEDFLNNNYSTLCEVLNDISSRV